MAEAIVLARRGSGRVHPNPLVGAVVLKGDRVVGRGWHAEFGGIHAEPMALREAGEEAHGSTLVVTLEPCNHHGKTPPCVNAIIASGVRRVVIGITDPNPVASGGVAALRAAGLDVVLSVGDGRIRHDNFRFLHSMNTLERPFVTVKLAVSMDGYIADARHSSQWISSEEARAWVHELRAQYAAIGAGARTVLADKARLTVRGAITPRIPPTRVIFDRSGRLTPEHGIFRDAPTVPVLVVVGADSLQDRLAGMSGVTTIVADSLHAALSELAKAKIDSLLIEGGGELAGALLREGWVDRVHQVVAPLWLGNGVPAWAGLGSLSVATSTRWNLVDLMRLGDSVVLTLDRP